MLNKTILCALFAASARSEEMPDKNFFETSLVELEYNNNTSQFNGPLYVGNDLQKLKKLIFDTTTSSVDIFENSQSPAIFKDEIRQVKPDIFNVFDNSTGSYDSISTQVNNDKMISL